MLADGRVAGVRRGGIEAPAFHRLPDGTTAHAEFRLPLTIKDFVTGSAEMRASAGVG